MPALDQLSPKQLKTLTTIWMAIAFVLACRELNRRTGVSASDWGKELRQRAYDKLIQFSDSQLARFMQENFDFD